MLYTDAYFISFQASPSRLKFLRSGRADGGKVMNQSKRILLSRIVLGCLFFAMPAAAAADPDGDFRSKPLEGATVADVQGESLVVEASGLPGILPTQLDSWGADPTETADFWALSFPTLPQGRLAQKPPFIAWDHLELGGFAGGVKYGPATQAKNTTAVVPNPPARGP